ncbi:MAG: ExeA family protein [Rhodocyclaceae bacterium]|nr:ExeA family protein [Rhodocyclaceae bacterium]
MPLKLKGVMLRHGISHSELAESLKQKHRAFSGRPFSRTSVVKMLNGGWRPARTPWAEIQAATEAFLREAGVPDEAIAEVWDEDVVPHFSTKPLNRRMGEPRGDNNNDDDAVEIEAEMLSSQAKKHFNLFRDPFVDDVQGPEDLFLSADQRYVREAMYQAARQGGWLIAVVGESGSGKTTLRRETIDRVGREGLQVNVIQPKAFDKGLLNASHICHAILADVRPSERPKRSLEALARQVERALIESSRSGMSHVLMIEEAHDLNIQTLKYLKRFWEMEDGFKKLLSIVLIGQPELREKLNERQYFEAREVIRRCEIVELMPLDGNVGDYLALKMRRIGSALEALLEADAVDAIRTHPALLRTGRGPSRNQTVSLVYPLVVNNLVTKALNRAAYLGAPQVTADIVRGC